MKDLHIYLPKDVLRSLLEGKQANYPYVAGDVGLRPGEPLRIVLYAAEPPARRKFKGGRI